MTLAGPKAHFRRRGKIDRLDLTLERAVLLAWDHPQKDPAATAAIAAYVAGWFGTSSR